MADSAEYELKINGFTPDTFPMERLSEYLAALSKLLGFPSSVHFVAIKEGSACLATKVEDREQPKVQRRLEQVRLGGGPMEARNGFQKIDDMLLEDGADAVLQRASSNLIIFPGKARIVPITFDPVIQHDTLDGVLIGLGGRDESVPIHLMDGDKVYKCNTTRTRAKEMAHYIFGPILRVNGMASWRRDADGAWRLNTMDIEDFHPLDDAPVTEVITRLRAIKGNLWHESPDPYAELAMLRGNEDSK